MIHELLPWVLAIGKYILASAVLLVFYRVFLRKHASFRESRLFLLSVAMLALAVSQFRIEVTHPAPTIVEVKQQTSAVMTEKTGSTVTAGVAGVTKVAEVASVASVVAKPEPTSIQLAITWILSHLLQLLLSIYIMVVLTLVINILLQYRSIHKLRHTGMGSLHDGYTLVEHPKVSTPFSFATTIFLPSNLNSSQRDIVVSHERWHIRHKHYVDVVVQELMCCLFWFNPIQWMLRKDLRSVHEYQADRSVLNEGCDVYRYQTVILEEVLGHHFRLANGFNQSFTKKRFIQMKQVEPFRLNTLRKVASVCFLVILFATLSVVPGKSQVIRVERSSTSSRTENGTNKTVTTRSVDTLSNIQFNVSPITIDPTSAPGQIQRTFNQSVDSQLRMVNRVLPIAHRLARLPQPAENVSEMNALLEALEIKVNNEGISYGEFSQDAKNKLSREAFQGLEKTLSNMRDSLQLYRTQTVNRYDSPYLMRLVSLGQHFFSDKVFNTIFMELFKIMGVRMGSAMDGMSEDMTSTLSSLNGNNDEAVDEGNGLKGFGKAMGELFVAMTQMESTLNNASSQTDKQTVTPQERIEVERQLSTQRFGSESQRSVQNRSDNNEYSAVAKRWIRNLTDQNSLVYIARNDDDPDFRKESILRLTDQNTLAYIARNDREPSVRKVANQRLTDQNTLAYVARNDNDRDVRVEAILRLTDQNTLAHIARNDREPSVRKIAIRRLTDQNTLAYVARNDNERDVRVEAILWLTDQNTLAYVARNDSEPSVRSLVVRKLTDHNTLAYIARNDNDKNIRIEAIARIEQLEKN